MQQHSEEVVADGDVSMQVLLMSKLLVVSTILSLQSPVGHLGHMEGLLVARH